MILPVILCTAYTYAYYSAVRSITVAAPSLSWTHAGDGDGELAKPLPKKIRQGCAIDSLAVEHDLSLPLYYYYTFTFVGTCYVYYNTQ